MMTENSDIATETPDKESYLPGWVLKMRSKINESRRSHANVEGRLQALTETTDVLGTRLVELLPPAPLSNATEQEKDTSQHINKLISISLFDLSDDVIGIVVQYLHIHEAVALTAVSKSFQERISTIDIEGYLKWVRDFRRDLPSVEPFVMAWTRSWTKASSDVSMLQYLLSRRVDMRASVIRRAKESAQCISFLRLIKNQRGMQRLNDIAPRRHLSHEIGVTHPLPVFQLNRIPAHGERLKPAVNVNSGLMLSRAETFSADHRQIANNAMDVMFRITSHIYDPIHTRLFCEGVVSVLIALLSNESGSLQHYSCGVLANMLCWERCRNQVNQESLSVSSQVMACSGHKVLSGLLTSPSAKINLAGMHSSLVNGVYEIATSSAVQGMAMKQSSRALVNLFCKYPIPNSVGCWDNEVVFVCTSLQSTTENGGIMSKVLGDSRLEDDSNTATSSKEAPQRQVKPSDRTHRKSLSTRAELVSARSSGSGGLAPISRRKIVAGVKFGSSSSRRASIEGHQNVSISRQLHAPDPIPIITVEPLRLPVAIDASVDDLKQSVTTRRDESIDSVRSAATPCSSIVSDLFLGDGFARPWVMEFYFQSGNLKDKCVVYIRWSADGKQLYGRGQDHHGLFVLCARSEVGIVGCVWQFSLAYVPLLSMLSDISVSIIDWITMTSEHVHFDADAETELVDAQANDGDILGYNRNSFGVIRRRANMLLTAFWSDGLPVDSATELEPDDVSKSRTNLFSRLNIVTAVASAAAIETTTDSEESQLSLDAVVRASSTSMGMVGHGLWGVWEIATAGNNINA